MGCPRHLYWSPVKEESTSLSSQRFNMKDIEKSRGASISASSSSGTLSLRVCRLETLLTCFFLSGGCNVEENLCNFSLCSYLLSLSPSPLSIPFSNPLSICTSFFILPSSLFCSSISYQSSLSPSLSRTPFRFLFFSSPSHSLALTLLLFPLILFSLSLHLPRIHSSPLFPLSLSIS